MATVPVEVQAQAAVGPARSGTGGRAWLRYALRRLVFFFAVLWVAASLNFFLPRLVSGKDPVRSRLRAVAATGASATGIEEVVATYQAKFGLTTRSGFSTCVTCGTWRRWASATRSPTTRRASPT